jgi:hypothetical protein
MEVVNVLSEFKAKVSPLMRVVDVASERVAWYFTAELVLRVSPQTLRTWRLS